MDVNGDFESFGENYYVNGKMNLYHLIILYDYRVLNFFWALVTCL